MKVRFALLVALFSTPASAEGLCLPVTDTALFADPALSEEVRVIFQFDGAQFVPEHRDGQAMIGRAYDVRMQPMLETGSFIRASDWDCSGADVPASGPAGESFDLTAAACAQQLSDTRLVLTKASMQFYESSCDILNDQDLGNGQHALSLTCYGEGEEWATEMRLERLADGGLTLAADGQTRTYLSCSQ